MRFPQLNRRTHSECNTIALFFFFQLIGEDRYRAIDKIKTIGSTYMAAVGLIPEYRIANEKEDGGISAVTYVGQVCRIACSKNFGS